MQNLFLNNKCAIIWAFDEMIDNNTENDGAIHITALIEIKNIIKYFIDNNDIDEDTKEMIINYNNLLINDTIIILSHYINKENYININNITDKYYLCGWTGHNIIIFIKIQQVISEIETENKYDFGIINCGQGVELHGYNDELCNGIVIFKDNLQEKIILFFNMYKNYLTNTANIEQTEGKYIYKSFYLMLFKALYNTNVVNFNKNKKIQCYKLKQQSIGSCVFTNTINIVYHLYIKKNSTENLLDEYLNWYNKLKNIIKEKIYEEIIVENNIKYYNIYRYILDTNNNTNKKIIINNNYEKNNNINIKIYNYTIRKIDYSEIHHINTIMSTIDYRDNQFTDPENHLDDMNMNQSTFIDNLFTFFCSIKSFNNNMKLLIPLLLLYNFKKKYPDIEIDKKILFFNIQKNYQYVQYINIEHIIYTCIYILLVKDNKDNTFLQEIYYNNNNNEEYNSKQKNNFKHYNYTVFQYIPIINNFYCNIIKELINDLRTNIQILPDINDTVYMKNPNYIIIDEYTKQKALIKYYLLFNRINKDNTTIEIKKYNAEWSINLLLWYIFIYNIDYKLFNIKDEIFKFEVYGYIDLDTYENTNFILNSTNDSIKDNPSTNLYLLPNIINIFLSSIKKRLDDYDLEYNKTSYLLLEILKLYIIYFYICYISINKEDESKYRTKYETYLLNNFDDIYHNPFKTILDIYVYKYNLVYKSIKKIFVIDDKTLISSIEKPLFTLKEYEYIHKYSDKQYYYILCQSIIKFYIIYTNNYKLVFHSDKNSIDSINIIKILLNNNISIYLILNFNFIEKDNKIIGSNKINKKIEVQYIDSQNITYTEDKDSEILFDVINSTDLSNPYYKNFYNLMSHNDNGLFLYKNKDNTIYYLRTFRYEFLFTMTESNIYININDIDYIVKWCNDTDNYNNYGILKLYNKNDSKDIKIICIYNYNNIIDRIDNTDSINFIDRLFKSSEEDIFRSIDLIPDEYKLYYYRVLTSYNDKIILTNISEVLSLLINCLYYNSPFLILKNIEQIKIILNNNNHDKTNLNKLLNTLFLNFDNIYSLPILFLFYEKELNKLYKSSNFIYNHYKILLNLIEISNDTYYFSKIGTDIKDNKLEKYLFFQEKCNYTFNNNNNILKIYYGIESSKYINIHKSPVLHSNNNKSKTNIIYKDISTYSFETLFKELIEKFILDFDKDLFNNNIIKANELYTYLINDKKIIFPIQEILMGSGKSTVLTSYICILLLHKFLGDKSEEKEEIYIVLPELLINSSFITLMKYVFPLFTNIEFLLYPNKPLYDSSYHLYLITDTNYKIMFLERKIITENKYMIYDEVDMMANPLTCELNRPIEKDNLVTDILFILGGILYDEIFNNDDFWKGIIEKTKIGYHYYIYEINEINNNYIIDYYNNNIRIQKINDILKDYIKNNILIFILTKQFNLDYGMPENYNLDTAYIYKFKAIPYSAVDSPIIGSEFSDPILTYILTLFCYKIIKNNFLKINFRKIDKDYIVKYYSKLYEYTINNKDILDKMKTFFKASNIPFEYNYYKKNEKYYMDNYSDTFDIDESTFDIIIKKILEMNKTYYKECKNISFNDLLLSKNVKNFICFTGTAYIKPPTGFSEDINFDENKYITNSMMKNNTVVQNVENIINNTNILTNIYNNNDSEDLIENIFSCLNLYDVLIDIGGLFINYNLTKFTDKYKNIKDRKKYLVYFDNGRKIINLDTSQVETDKSINKSKKDTFYFFNNKNITGVDAKDIMNPQVCALVVITNKTNMRDFSQGIFRLRRLLDNIHETFDIIFDTVFDKLFTASINQTAGDPGDSIAIKLNTNEDIRKKIIANLNYQQTVINTKKEKSLTKQNIFGLIKTDTFNFQNIDLFIDPTSKRSTDEISNFNQYISEINDQLEKPINYKFNIDNNNILKISKKLKIS